MGYNTPPTFTNENPATEDAMLIVTDNQLYFKEHEVPTGAMLPWAGSSASVPTGYLLCDGQAVSQATYAALYAVIAGTYDTSGGQSAPPAGDFRVPNLIGQIPLGSGTALSTTSYTRGNAGGAETHTLTESEMPAHTHGLNSSTNYSGGGSAATEGGGINDATGSTGGGAAHNNMQPYMVIGGWIIKT